MTDRELLELAAKAAGVNMVCKQLLAHGMEVDTFFNLFEDGRYGCWNPLTDDGDALRLAVTLACEYPEFNEIKWRWTGRGIRVFASGSEGYGIDVSVATRRAIVRAAAEIGKEKK